MGVKARLDPLDGLIWATFVTLMFVEWSQLLGLVTFGFGAAPSLLVTLFLLGTVLLIAPHRPRLARLGKMEVITVMGTTLVSAAGVLSMIYGLTFGGIVALGYLLVFMAAYAIYRMEIHSTTARAPSSAHEVLGATSPTLSEMEVIDIFRGLKPQEVKHFAALGQRFHFQADTPLAEANAAGENVYGILSGQVELYTRSAMGDATVRIAGPGESFPLAALSGSGKLITSARVMHDADVVVISVDAFNKACRAHPEIGIKVYVAVAGILAERYRATLSRLTGAMRETLRQVDFWANV